MKWFRLWTDILDDPKLAKLDDGEYRRFINLLAIACEQDKTGHIFGSIDELAWRMRDDGEKLKSSIEKLLSLKILSQNPKSYLFLAWNKRQFKSDKSSDRWREWNAKRKVPKEKNITEQNRHRTDKESNVEPNNVQTFDTFWGMYPKKVGKQAAERAWKKLKSPSKILDKIASNLSWQASSEQWTKENGRFIPNPATYLNQGRWEDEPNGNKESGSPVSRGLARFLASEDE